MAGQWVGKYGAIAFKDGRRQGTVEGLRELRVTASLIALTLRGAVAYTGFGGHGSMDLMERKRKDERTTEI